jgi:glucose/arabinose dehydrogenase
MKNVFSLTAVVFVYMLFALSSCSVQDEMAKPAAPAAPAPAAKAEKAPPAEKATAEKAPAKAKVEKTKGDVGLLDLEKNYMILVTKEGKLVTLDFDQKTNARKDGRYRLRFVGDGNLHQTTGQERCKQY